jgi:hypothetical protein
VHSTYCEVSTAGRRDGAPSKIGRAYADVEVYLLDTHLAPVGEGSTGELVVGGAGVARGYLGRPRLTAERFVPDSFASKAGARAYRSGDLGRRDLDGGLVHLGRSDDQVQIRGFRVELGEIEAALRTHERVSACAAALSGERLVGYVVSAAPVPADTELRRHLADRLPDYMVPTAFVSLDGLPLTPSGKLDRRGLPEPGKDRPELAVAFAASETEAENIWQDVLGVVSVGIDDDFFDLGGNSLLVMRMLARVRDQFGVDLSVRTVFDGPTVRLVSASLGLPSTMESLRPALVARKRRIPDLDSTQ